MKRPAILFLLSYAVCGGVAEAATYYVSTAGNNSYSCAQAQSPATPRLTIAAGLGCLAAGDTLLLRAGTYLESISSIPSGTSWSNKVRMAAYAGETVWIQPSSGNWVVYFRGDMSYIELDGININGANIDDAAVFFEDREAIPLPHHIRMQNAEIHHREGAGQDNAAVLMAGHDNEFINLTVHGTGGPYAFYVHGTSNLIEGCNIYGVSTAGIQIYHNGSAPNYAPPTSNIVRNTSIHDITQSWFFGSSDTRLWGIMVTGNNNQIYNNVIYGLSVPYQSGNAAIAIGGGSIGTKAWNNTIYNNTTDGIYIDSSNTEVENNIVYGNSGSAYVNVGTGTTQSNNLFNVNPLFVNPSASDLRLQAASPAVNAGISISAVTIDFAGMARPQGGAFDIGAYEFGGQASGPSAPTQVRIVSALP